MVDANYEMIEVDAKRFYDNHALNDQYCSVNKKFHHLEKFCLVGGE